MLLRCDCLIPFYCQMFCHNNVSRPQCDLLLYVFLHPFFNANVLLHVTHSCLLYFIGVLEAMISWTSSASSMSDYFLHFFCHLVAHRHLTWAYYLLPWPFQNYLLYCGLQMFMSISFFIFKSPFSTTLFFFVIFYLIFCAAFNTIWFTYFTNVIVYFISISDNCATIILGELFLGFFLQFFIANILLHDAHLHLSWAHFSLQWLFHCSLS